MTTKKRSKKIPRIKSRGPDWQARDLPAFSNADEEEKFWSSHEFGSMASEERLVYEPRSTSVARDHVYRIRLDDEEMATLQLHARRGGVPASTILRDAVRNLARRDAGSPVEISPSISAPLPQGAIAHVQVVNKGPFVARVRCWLRFFRENGSRVFDEDMPARWSCAPEPITPILQNGNSIVHIYDPSKLHLQGIADFARLEGHPVAVAIKLADGVWGWTPESYAHNFRHPRWKLPEERLFVMAVVLADGKQILSERFILDASAPAVAFALTTPAAAKPRSTATDSEVRAPTDLKLIMGTG